jgi:hypothetical protein
MGRVALELDHFAVLTVEKQQMYRECCQGNILGNSGLKGSSGQRGIAFSRAFVRSLFGARLPEGLMVRVLCNAVSGGNAAPQAVRTASSLAAVLPSRDGR